MDSIMQLIIDLTKANVGSEVTCARSAYRSIAADNVCPPDIALVLRMDQVWVKSEFPGARLEIVDDFLQAPSAVSRMLSQASSGSASAVVMLFSYNGAVLRLAYRPWQNVRVLPSSFSGLRIAPPFAPSRTAPEGGIPDLIWRFDRIAPLEDALKVLLDVLRRNGYRSESQAVRQASIRPLMAADSRFSGKSATTGTGGMMKQLVAIAEARGQLGVSWVDRVNPLIWIKDERVVNAAVATSDGNATSFSPERDGAVTEIPSNLAIPPTRTATIDTTQVKGPGIDVPVKTDVPRSRTLGSVLRDENMGPFAEARSAMETAIDKLGTTGLSVDELISRAVDDSRTQLGESVKKQPWLSIGNFYRRILLKWGALLDEDGRPIGPGWGSGPTRVKSMSENWTVQIDAAMLLALIEKVDDISDRDAKHLARAIYHRASPEDVDKITRAVVELIRQGKVEQIDREGVSVLRTKAAPRSTGDEGQSERAAIRVIK